MPRRILPFVLIVAACLAVPHWPALVAWDGRVVQALAGMRSAGWDRVFWTATWIGATRGFLVALILPTLWFLFRRRWVDALYYFFGVGLLKLSASLLKIIVARPRPAGGLEYQATFSMPSGHAANAVFLFGVLAVLLWKSVRSPAWRALSALLAACGILAIDLSRVYLGVHYPSDVILGSLYTASGLWILAGLRRGVFAL